MIKTQEIKITLVDTRGYRTETIERNCSQTEIADMVHSFMETWESGAVLKTFSSREIIR